MTEKQLRETANKIADKYGYERPTVTIGPLRKSFLAMCFTEQKHIVVTAHVALTYRACALKVILKHEICHLKVANHGPRFKEALEEMGLKTVQRRRNAWYESDEYYNSTELGYEVEPHLKRSYNRHSSSN